MPSSHRPEQFFAHVLDGKAKNNKNVIPMKHGNDIFENVIPMLHGKHKKNNILLEICVKVDFCNTSRARTLFFLRRHDEQHGQLVDFMTSFLNFPSRTSEKNQKSMNF